MALERSKLVDKNTYEKWYNLAEEEVNNKNLIPERSKEEIFKLISKENWLMFCPEGIDRIEAIQFPEPNVFFDVLSKEGNLTGFGRLGLTFNNLGAYDKFKTIMNKINEELKDKITRELLGLKYDWKIKVDKKIKKYNYAQTPEYEEVGMWETRNINQEIVDEIIEKAKKIREEGIVNRENVREQSGNPKKFYNETPTINLMEAEFKLSEEEFRDRISEIFKILSLCLGVKGDVEVNKIIREKTKRIEEIKKKLELMEDEVRKGEKLIGVVEGFTEDTIKTKKKEIRKLKEERERLENEI